MSALAIDSPFEVAPRSTRRDVAPPAVRPQRGGAPTLPRATNVVPLRAGQVHSCAVAAPRPRAVPQPNLGEWHLNARGTAIVGVLMSLAMVLGLIAVVVQYLAIPA